MGIASTVNTRLLFLMGTTLLVTAGVLALLLQPSPKPKHAPPPPPVVTTTSPAPAPPPQVAMSWNSAGALVWHAHDSDPTWLGQQLRNAGFGWVAVYFGSTGNAYPIDPGWIARFEQASGLPVGGWSVLVGYPHYDAGFAAKQLKQYGLSFYIADAEAQYQGKPGASQQFVTAFRAAEPTLPAGLSSYCNAQGIGLKPWASAGFAFLPQAYVNDFGASVSPAACVSAAAAYFPRADVHPTVACYQGRLGYVTPARFARLLAAAGTTGFSIYPAETLVNPKDWQTYGQAIASLHIAARPS